AATAGTTFAVGNPQTRTLVVNTVGSGYVTLSPDQPGYPSGSTVQLTAVASSGWAFSAWSGALGGGTDPASLLMDADKTVTATFADIQAPVVAVVAPNGGEVLHQGAHTNLTWTASDNAAVTSVDLSLSRSGVGGPWESIATGIPNSGSHDWLVAGALTTNAFLRVTARDAATNSPQDLSKSAVSIASGAGVLDGPITP